MTQVCGMEKMIGKWMEISGGLLKKMFYDTWLKPFDVNSPIGS